MVKRVLELFKKTPKYTIAENTIERMLFDKALEYRESMIPDVESYGDYQLFCLMHDTETVMSAITKVNPDGSSNILVGAIYDRKKIDNGIPHAPIHSYEVSPITFDDLLVARLVS